MITGAPDRGEVVLGSTGRFLGRNVCPRAYVSGTQEGGHCHGDHEHDHGDHKHDQE